MAARTPRMAAQWPRADGSTWASSEPGARQRSNLFGTCNDRRQISGLGRRDVSAPEKRNLRPEICRLNSTQRRPPNTFLAMALPMLEATERTSDLVKASP